MSSQAKSCDVLGRLPSEASGQRSGAVHDRGKVLPEYSRVASPGVDQSRGASHHSSSFHITTIVLTCVELFSDGPAAF